jgi:small-conductance mechanosensitive channel
MSFSEILQRTFLGSRVEDWLMAAIVFTALLLGQMLVRYVLIKRVSAIAKRTATDLDDLVVDLLVRTKFLFMVAMALGAAAARLLHNDQVMTPGVAAPPPSLGQVLVQVFVVFSLFLQAVVWGNGLIAYWIGHMAARQASASGGDSPGNIAILRAMGGAARVVLFVALFLVALDAGLHIHVTPLVTGLGIGGIAIALAVQNILGDLFGAVSILVDKPFAVGDFVVVDNHKGNIEHIGMKSTRVRSLGGEQIIFSNADLLKSRVRNFKRMQERRVAFTTGVTYSTDPEKLARIPGIIRELVESQQPIRFERCHFLKYADSALEFETVFWVLSPDYMIYADIQQTFNLALLKSFAAEGIEFAYPTRTVIVEGREG